MKSAWNSGTNYMLTVLTLQALAFLCQGMVEVFSKLECLLAGHQQIFAVCQLTASRHR